MCVYIRGRCMHVKTREIKNIMEYYATETASCLMEELLHYANVEDLNSNNINLISSSASSVNYIDAEYCSFELDLPIDIFPFSEFTTAPAADYTLNTNLQQLDYSYSNDIYAAAHDDIIGPPCKDHADNNMSFNVGFCPHNDQISSKNKLMSSKEPSKNLMAERRRRKRLNDRLSMLRSVVPKISKMDRTSILGDTIDYMKELSERINNLQQQLIVMDDDDNIKGVSLSKQPMTISNLQQYAMPPKQIRNSPKMEVESWKDGEDTTGIKIWCAMKPGLLLSTMNTVEEELGLHIHQCVVSCFTSDFTMEASCSHEELKERDPELIKQALIRNAAPPTFLYN